MGKVASSLRRSIININVENRAHKVLSKEKPSPAPKYESTIKEVDRLNAEFPTLLEEQYKKDILLNQRLRNVFVTSEDPVPNVPKPERPNQESKVLPLNRGQVEDFEYGFQEPKIIPVGKTTLRQALQFISDHQTDSVKFSAERIAREYKVELKVIENTLKYFRMYQVYVPKIRKTKAIFATPATIKKPIDKAVNDLIEESNKKPKQP